MKRMNKIMVFVLSTLMVVTSHAQDDEGDKRPARPAFESQLLIDNQTVVIPTKNTLEWDIMHRFGAVENKWSDLYGLYAPSNVKLAFTYSVLERLNVGFGFTKFSKYVDFSAKYLILRQTRDNSMPISLAYYGNLAIDNNDNTNFEKDIHRLSYFNQLLIASRINSKLSLQISPSFAHFNAVDSLVSHDMLAIGIGGRYKFGSQHSIIFDYTQPITEHDGMVDVQPNISFGLEVSTSSHAFQIFVSNYQALQPQENLTYNENKFDASGILIGFNITRLWNL